MKNKLIANCLLCAAGCLLLAACKTTEANYREAYDTVISHQKKLAERNADLDSIAGGKITTGGRPFSYDLNGKKLETRALVVKVADKNIADNRTAAPERYCIVAAEFRQAFNAQSMMRRLRAAGYPDAFVVIGTDDHHYVIAATTSMAFEALEMLEKIKADKLLSLKAPCPWVMEVAQLRR